MFLRFSKYNIIFIVHCISLTLLQVFDSTDGIINNPFEVTLKIYHDDRTTNIDVTSVDSNPKLTIDLDDTGNVDINKSHPYEFDVLNGYDVALYYFPTSPVCRAVIILGYMLNIRFNYRPVEIYRNEHKTKWYKKMNPEQVVPTIMIDEQNNRIFKWESHDILIYLWKKFRRSYSVDLYPENNTVKMEKINNGMELDKNLFKYFKLQYFNWIWENKSYDTNYENEIKRHLKTLDDILAQDDFKFVAGDAFTLADISLYATVTTYQALQIDLNNYTNIKTWLSACIENSGELVEYIPKNYNDQNVLKFLSDLVKIKSIRVKKTNLSLDDAITEYDQNNLKEEADRNSILMTALPKTPK